MRLETFLSIDGIGNPDLITQDDLDALENAFLETYALLGQFNCDVLFRRIRRVEIQIYDFPPMGDDLVNINFIFKVRYSCRGEDCMKGNFVKKPAALFSLKNGFLGRGDRDSKKKEDPPPDDPPPEEGNRKRAERNSNLWDLRRRARALESSDRQLQTDDDICGECNTENPSRRSASPRQFVDAYRDSVEALMLSSVVSITNILEIQEQDCEGIEERFTDSVLFELEGDPNNVTDSDLQLLGETFLSSYNYYSEVQCDGRFLDVDSIDMINEPILSNETRRQLQFYNFFNNVTLVIFYMRGLVSGGCRSCGGDYRLDGNDAIRSRFRRELQQNGIRGSVVTEHETRKQQQARRTTTQLIGNSDINMGDYIDAMEEGCTSCPPPPSISVVPSSAPSTNPTRKLPGKTHFGADKCFCARKGPDFEELTVGLDDTFNVTFKEERDDGRYRGFDSYKSVKFGNMGGGGGGGGGDGGGTRRARTNGSSRSRLRR
mmetsp:Transcript_8366/g.13848  ORF Transcript_8366/g.13848 Transcript_8366/m.13848 type:complete len:489 (-) Transcript_8366:402-1868(-)